MSDPTTEHVLVTGAASGLGLHTALGFAKRSARITMVDFSADRLQDAAAQVREAGAESVHTLTADLRDPDAPEKAIAAAWQTGPIDVLVNCAGVYPSTPFLELNAATWDAVQNINVRAPMLATVALAHLVIEAGRQASIVNISSTASLRTRPGASAYSTSKCAVEMLTRSSALELGPHGIRVNAISPGFIPVDSTVNPVTSEYSDAVSGNPLGRQGSADNIARAIIWIAGSEAEWVTGSVLRVDGGSSTGSHNLPLSWPTTSIS